MARRVVVAVVAMGAVLAVAFAVRPSAPRAPAAPSALVANGRSAHTAGASRASALQLLLSSMLRSGRLRAFPATPGSVRPRVYPPPQLPQLPTGYACPVYTAGSCSVSACREFVAPTILQAPGPAPAAPTPTPATPIPTPTETPATPAASPALTARALLPAPASSTCNTTRTALPKAARVDLQPPR